MKYLKITLLFALLVGAMGLKAQVFSSNNMMEMSHCKTRQCFEDMVLPKGFAYSKTIDVEGTGYMYLSTKSIDDGAGNFTFNKAGINFTADNKWIHILLLTNSVKTYSDLYAGFVILGFSYVQEETVDGKITYYYKSDKYPDYILMLTEKTDKTPGGSGYVYFSQLVAPR